MGFEAEYSPNAEHCTWRQVHFFCQYARSPVERICRGFVQCFGNDRIDLAYELETNRWQGEIRVQLNVRDMRAAVS